MMGSSREFPFSLSNNVLIYASSFPTNRRGIHISTRLASETGSFFNPWIVCKFPGQYNDGSDNILAVFLFHGTVKRAFRLACVGAILVGKSCDRIIERTSTTDIG